jgi:AAA+ ATPase superfamily predicted ATPase
MELYKNIDYNIVDMMECTIQPVTGPEFIGREEILSKMIDEMERGGWGYAIIGTRKIGKTSLLQEFQIRINKRPKAKAVYVDVTEYPSRDINDFLIKLQEEIIDTYEEEIGMKHKVGAITTLSKDILKTVLSSIRVGVLKGLVEFHLEMRENPPATDKLIEKTYELADKLAKETKTQCILIIDEFPELTNYKLKTKKLGDSIIAAFRSRNQLTKNTQLIIASSIRATMEKLVIGRNAPFYRQLQTIILEPFTFKETQAFSRKYLKTTNKKAVEKLYQKTNGIPLYLQILGRNLQRHKKITTKLIEYSYHNMIQNEVHLLFHDTFYTLPALEQQILICMAYDKTKPSEIAKITKTPINQLNTYLLYLQDTGYMQKEEKGKYTLTDPIIAEWIRTKYDTVKNHPFTPH